MKPIVIRLKRKGPTEGYSVSAEHPGETPVTLECPNGIAFLSSDIATVLNRFNWLTEGDYDNEKPACEVESEDYASFLIWPDLIDGCVLRAIIVDTKTEFQKCVQYHIGSEDGSVSTREIADLIGYSIAIRMDPDSLKGKYLRSDCDGRPYVKPNPDYVQPPIPRYYQP